MLSSARQLCSMNWSHHVVRHVSICTLHNTARRLVTTKGNGFGAAVNKNDTVTTTIDGTKLIEKANDGFNASAGFVGVLGLVITVTQYLSAKNRDQAETTRELMHGMNQSERTFAKVISYRHLQCMRAERDNRDCDWQDRAAMDIWLFDHHDALCEWMDHDGDGYLTFDELQDGLVSCMMPEDETYDFIDYLFRLTHENRRRFKADKSKKHNTNDKSNFFSWFKKKHTKTQPPGTICIDMIRALKPVLEKSQNIHDEIMPVMGFLDKAATYEKRGLINEKQLDDIFDVMFIKNYIKNILPLNMGYKRRKIRHLKDVSYSADNIEKTFRNSKKWHLLELLSKQAGYKGATQILKKAKTCSQYYRFSDSPEGKRVLPAEVLKRLSGEK